MPISFKPTLERRAGAASVAGAQGSGFEGIGIVVPHRDCFCPAEPHTFMRAGMDQFVMDNQIAALGQG